MKVELSRIVATIKDGHTSLLFPVNNYLPLSFYIFKDGVYIIKATERYKNLLYKKVDAIEGVKIEEVLYKLGEIISYENEQYLKGKVVKYMQAADVLYGLFIIDDASIIDLTVEGEVHAIETVSSGEIKYIDKENLPIYAKKSDVNLWCENIKKNNEVYIKYNFCREQGEITIEEKIKEIIKLIENNNIKKVTVDLRNNLGGNSMLLRPLIDYIKSNKEINRKENLKIIIGRETFSSALINAYEFKNETNGRFVGEATGGKPNSYGEILKFTLPNSKFLVTYSTKYYKLVEDDLIMALQPDEFLYEKIEDFNQ